ncbi:haloacid dehalogenase [Annulohypoxylon maeteangense]|uniref:haloacid dehalogenase n=1 Tax=Annulohypoxylon maeteangense TaxID=1927788 RepID=UPI0020087B74|nr:haloacid dehalogenase [Annulohypoxylon maeteangense]KAI0881262.1 haloacid dehalogenase [Annulohypoxylon maeteangense]
MASENKYPDLTSFKALSFDCYGTLIDWETGFLSTVRLLTSQLPPTHPLNTDPPLEALRLLNAKANAYEVAQPTLPYNELLAEAITAFATTDLSLPGLSDSIAEPFGNSPGTWTAFPDTIAGLQKLGKRYKLAILSNVDNQNIAATVGKQLAPAKFDAVYTAQDIGAYKPDHKNFAYLFAHLKEDLGIDREKGELLHVARSLTADHVPAKELGLQSVWISRGGEKEAGRGVGGDYEALKGKVAFGWRFDTIGDFADEVERQFSAKEKV